MSLPTVVDQSKPQQEVLLLEHHSVFVVHSELGECESSGHHPASVQVSVGDDQPYKVCWGCAP